MILTGDFSFPNGGAATARIRNLAQALDALGGAATVLPLANRVEGWPELAEMLFHADGTQVVPPTGRGRIARGAWPASQGVGAKLRWVFWSYISTWLLAAGFSRDRACRDGEILFLYGRSYLRLMPFILIARSKGMKTALDVVEGVERFHGAGGMLSPVYWDWWLGSRLLPRLVDRVYAISTGLAERCLQLKARDVRLLPAIEAWPSRPPSPKPVAAVRCLVYVGGLTAKEVPDRLLALVESLAQMNSKVLVAIAGRYMDNPEGRQWAQRIGSAAVARGIVSMRGSLSDADLDALKEQADGFLLLRADTVAERLAFPTRLVEFLKTGRPLWTSDVGDVRRYLQDEKSVFLLSTDPARAAAHLRHTLEDTAGCQRVGTEGFLAGQANFDRSCHVRSLMDWETAKEARMGGL